MYNDNSSFKVFKKVFADFLQMQQMKFMTCVIVVGNKQVKVGFQTQFLFRGVANTSHILHGTENGSLLGIFSIG